VVVKRGEYGAILFSESGAFAIPGLPLEEVKDPTGAGDSFAGGFLGYLAARRMDGTPHDEADLRRAMVNGSMMASLNVEDFGTERIRSVSADELNQRYEAFRQLVHFEHAVPSGTWT
jgi:sugar/nucleoside kinase (ribokinase family)